MSDAMSCGRAKCFKPAFLMCSRCASVYYCSKECQVASFSSHRLGCFELPTLIDVKAERTLSTIENSEECESIASETKAKPVAVVIEKKGQKSIEAQQQKPAQREIAKASEEPKQTARVESKPVQQRTNLQPIKVPAAPVEPRRVFFKDMDWQQLPRGEFQAVVVAAEQDQKLFTIFEASAKNMQLLESIGQAIEGIGDKEKLVGHKPQLKEVVLALFEGVFYRAVCEKVQPDGSFEVRFIDYGNAAVVQPSEIIRFDSKKIPKDIFVHQCLFSNFPDVLTEEVVNTLSGETVPVKGAYKEDGDEMYVASLVGI